MADLRCERSWLHPDQCAHCRGDNDDVPTVTFAPPHRERVSLSTVWIDRYRVALMPARCHVCHDDIEPGDPIGVTRAGSALCATCFNQVAQS